MIKKSPGYLIFDLDRVLFDTDFLINKNITDENEIFTLKNAKRVKSSNINPQDLVYPEVIKVLTILQKKSFSLFLFSEGDIKGQLFKIKYSGIDKFFPKEKMFVYSEEKEREFPKLLRNISKEVSRIWYFDDKPSKLKAVESLDSRIKTVLVCRGPWWKIKIAGFEPDYKIKDLTEIEEIL